MMQALTQYAEGNSTDSRIVPAMQRHWAAIGEHLKTTPPAMWGASRWMDAAVPMQWMMDHNLGDPRLDEALVSLRNQSVEQYDWQARFLDDGPIWTDADMDPGHEKEMHHGVNLAQAIKLGAVWYRVSKAQADLDNTAIALDRLDRLAGAPSGAYMSDELLTPPNTAARGTETCNVVETMYSMEMAFAISGNLSYADRLERLAYNALPAALWPDITANAYLQLTNQIMAKESQTHSWQHDGAKSTVYGLHRCCTANFNQGWPKFAQSVVHFSGDGGLAIPVYAPADASVPTVGGGAHLSITTDYPFNDTVEVAVSSKEEFPLHLRIPSWVEGAIITIDGGSPQKATAGAFYTVQVGPASKVVLQMHNEIRIVTGYNDSSVSIHRGPLLFAMDIGQSVQSGPQHVAMDEGRDTQVGTYYPGFNQYQCEATKPWNMALNASLEDLQFVGMQGPLPHQPFDPEGPPVHIKARGRQLPQWKEVNNSASPPPMSPVYSAEPWQDLVFVPFGATNIRMAQLPTLASEAPPPGPPAPPPAPTPPPPARTEEVDDGGFCKQFQKLAEGNKPKVASADECWQHCRDRAECMQAVFESAGPYGVQCFLGVKNMTERPTANRGCDGCVDHCYAKYGFGPFEAFV